MTLKKSFDVFKDFLYAKSLSKDLLKGTNVESLLELNRKNQNSILYSTLMAFNGGGAKAGISALKDGALALIKAHPVITSIAALAAIGWGLDHFVFDADEKFDKANKSLGEYSETVSDLEGVESELAEISSRMDELKAQGTLSLVEQEELANLERSNDQLERRKQILETLKDIIL